MNELSKPAIEAIDNILSNDKTLYSDSISLYDFCGQRSTRNTVLNEVYYYLLDNSFVTSNNPYSSVSKYLVQFTEEGRKLHREGSLLNYYHKDDPLDKRILEFLRLKREYVRHRDIQTSLRLDEIKCKETLERLDYKGFTCPDVFMCDGDYWNCEACSITTQGITYLDELNAAPTLSAPTHHSIPIIGDGNVVTIAHGNIQLDNLNINITKSEEYNNQLRQLGVIEARLDELTQIMQRKNEPGIIKTAFRWCGDVVKETVAKGAGENLMDIFNIVSKFIG
jgi:hypothetical protein